MRGLLAAAIAPAVAHVPAVAEMMGASDIRPLYHELIDITRRAFVPRLHVQIYLRSPRPALFRLPQGDVIENSFLYLGCS